MKLLFIARGGERTGLGHFARSQRLVETAKLRGHDVELFCVLDGPRSLAVGGARTISDEADLLSALASRPADDVIVVDMLDVQGAFAQRLETSSAPVVSLCPVALGATWPRLVILRSSPERCDERIPHLIGVEYAVLGQSVAPISEATFSKTIDASVQRVAVCFGGADPDNETLATVRALASQTDARIDVFVGPVYSHDETALHLGGSTEATAVKVHHAAGSLWEQLARSSVLVGGGGLMAYEAACSGLPSVHLVPQGTRREMLAPLEGAGAIRVVDRDAKEPHRSLCRLVASLDPETLLEIRRAALSLPLCNGHLRCVEAIEDLS